MLLTFLKGSSEICIILRDTLWIKLKLDLIIMKLDPDALNSMGLTIKKPKAPYM